MVDFLVRVSPPMRAVRLEGGGEMEGRLDSGICDGVVEGAEAGDGGVVDGEGELGGGVKGVAGWIFWGESAWFASLDLWRGYTVSCTCTSRSDLATTTAMNVGGANNCHRSVRMSNSSDPGR